MIRKSDQHTAPEPRGLEKQIDLMPAHGSMEQKRPETPLRPRGSQCDVTAHRLAETAVRENEERLAFALEAGQLGTFDWHLSTGRIVWSPTLERLHGYAPGTLPTDAQDYWSQLHPEDRERVQAQLQEILAGTDGHRLQYRIVRPDGTIRWLECFA